jgi:hypothetical protein
MAEQDPLEQARRALERAGVNVPDEDLARVTGLMAAVRPANVPALTAEPSLVLVPGEWGKR